MSHIRIYIKPDQISDIVKISDKALIHKIKNVLRLKRLEQIYLFDGWGKEYIYRLEEVAKKSILLKKEKLVKESPYPARRVTLGFPLEKEERVDFILQKSTELGVWKFIPFICERSLQRRSSTNKLSRWRRIIIEAARQSQRLWIPEIEETSNFKDICKRDFDLKLVGSLGGKTLDKKFDKRIKDILVIVGPVGDFSEAEYKKLKEKGFSEILLAANLLRTETAAMFAVGLINNFWDEPLRPL